MNAKRHNFLQIKSGAKFPNSAFLLGAVFLLTSTEVSAQHVSINEQLEFYGIQGRTPKRLLREMQKKAPPPAFGGADRFARAQSLFSWDLSFEFAGDLCKTEGSDVTVDMLYILPKWTNKERGSPELVLYWEEFEKNVFAHEQGHGDVALEVAADMARAILNTAPNEDCKVVMDAARLATHEVLRTAKDRQKAYDKQTQHGKTQGAYFDVVAAKGQR